MRLVTMADELKGLIEWRLHLIDGQRISVEQYYAKTRPEFRIESLAGRCEWIEVKAIAPNYPTFNVVLPVGSTPTIFTRKKLNCETLQIEQRTLIVGYIDKGIKYLWAVNMECGGVEHHFTENVRLKVVD